MTQVKHLKKNHVDDLISDTIKFLEDSLFYEAAKGLTKLAVSFADCGMTKESFINMRTYIVEVAKKNSGNENIENNLNTHEKQLRLQRNDRSQNENH